MRSCDSPAPLSSLCVALASLGACALLAPAGCGGGGGGGQDAGLADSDGGEAGGGDAPGEAADGAGRIDAWGGDAGEGAVDSTGDAGPTCPGSAGCSCEEDAQCDDGDPCTWGEICMFGQCVAGKPSPCDDGNLCTDDHCEPGVGCKQTDNDALCSDLDACTYGDRCEEGVCQAHIPKTCDDGNKCTTDACDPTQGCVFVHNALQCSDGNACLGKSYCAWGACPSGKIKPCGDGNACTWDTCDPVKGCKLLVLADLPLAATCLGAEVEGRCTEAFAAKGTWKQARAACWKWGGDLASVHSKQGNAAVRALATKVCGAVPAWIGLTDEVKEWWWRWTDGSAPGYLNWNKGEPNNAGDEDYTEMNAAGRWNDLGAKATLGCHVCDRPVAPACDDGDACTPPGLCGAGGCEQTGPPAGCDDADPCTVDLCAPVTGCGHEAVGEGLPCGFGGTCGGGACLLPAAATLTGASCKAIKEALPGAPSGVWWLDPDGAQGPAKPFAAYCDMATEGGGWTLVLKVDGTKNTLAYDAKAWDDATPIAPDKPALDTQQARLASYGSVPLSEVMLRMRTATSGPKAAVYTRTAILPIQAPSLHALIGPGKHVPTAMGAPWWKALLPKASLQKSCQEEGFNVAPTPKGARVRIGIVGNNENNCSTPDSWLGVGGNPNACGQKLGNAAGNIACYAASAGHVKTRSFAWVLVR